MTVSKRLRFEILRRDEHTCQYCGQMAPDVKLHVDHVKPKALGGSDTAENLVTACVDCNIGKTSSSVDAPMVEAIAQRNLDWEIRAQMLGAKLRGTLERDKNYCEEFDLMWNEAIEETGKDAPLPYGYQGTVYRWSGMGIPDEVLHISITTAFNAKRVSAEEKFTYLAGIIWNRIKEAEVPYEIPDSPRIFTEEELEQHWTNGFETGHNRVMDRLPELQARMDPLTLVVDRMSTPYIRAARWVA